jgi:hypothetical protein
LFGRHVKIIGIFQKKLNKCLTVHNEYIRI